MKISNSKILITGGASGMGKIMGQMALEKGAKTLVIWDINQENINSTVTELSRYGEVKGYRVDVSETMRTMGMTSLCSIGFSKTDDVFLIVSVRGRKVNKMVGTRSGDPCRAGS